MLAACEKRYDLSAYNEKTVFGAKTLASDGIVPLKRGLAKCFFGDLDVAHYDTTANRSQSFWLTLERLSHSPKKNEVILSKKVNKKSFDKSLSLNVGELEDGLYGYFLCSGKKGGCFNSKKKVYNSNIVISRAINKKANKSDKIYSANFFFKKGTNIIGEQKIVDKMNDRKKEFMKVLVDLYPDNPKAMFKILSPIIEVLKPQPIHLPTEKDLYDSGRRLKKDIVFEIPTADEGCDVRVLESLYLKQNEHLKVIERLNPKKP